MMPTIAEGIASDLATSPQQPMPHINNATVHRGGN
jgi:hypothetical protein